MAIRYSISELARDLGIDKSTVSRALRDHPGVSADTRARVKNYAKEVGYQPDPVFSKVAANRFNHTAESLRPAIAWIPLAPTSAEARLCRQGADETALRLGYHLTQFDAAAGLDGDALSDLLLERSVRGVILDTLNLNRPVPDLRWDQFTAIACGEGFRGPEIHRITPNAMTGIETAWRKAVEAGYRRIGFCADFHTDAISSDYEQAGMVAYEQIRCEKYLEPLPILNTRAPNVFLDWVKRNRPDVLFLARSELLDALIEAGYRVPEDIACILLRHSERHPGASAVDNRYDLIGKSAVELCDQLMRDFETGIPENRKSIRTETDWRDGGTLPKRGDPEPELLDETILHPVFTLSLEHESD